MTNSSSHAFLISPVNYMTKIFSHVDLVKAFNQIPIAPEDIHKIAICSPFGFYESTRRQFGFCNVSSTLQSFIDEITIGLEGIYAFIDGILIATKTYEYHTAHLIFPKIHDICYID
ncbi:transposon Ty3-G Gag-Pol polyprotein [Caerostris extrusa]|uniref:Transposon Ty3-G Gag-Pol polyprotein n=1 Tax=Caerostris extrusa TaxID=172846 RepID=A0AAV4TBT6_CAEEX|nr:transposon Ty3-G Gag-Pol polyprotein [Caerostris extrusa]